MDDQERIQQLTEQAISDATENTIVNVWELTGDWIAFECWHTGEINNTDLSAYVIRPDGDDLTLVAQNHFLFRSLQWASDGHLVFTLSGYNYQSIQKLHPQTGGLEEIWHVPTKIDPSPANRIGFRALEFNHTLAPTGDKIAYKISNASNSLDEYREGIVISNLNGNLKRVVYSPPEDSQYYRSIGEYIKWSSDGETLYFLETRYPKTPKFDDAMYALFAAQITNTSILIDEISVGDSSNRIINDLEGLDVSFPRTWSPNRTRLAYVTNDKLIVRNTITSTDKIVATLPECEPRTLHWYSYD